MTKTNKIIYSAPAHGMNPRVDAYLRKVSKWQEEIEKLRAILLDCELSEELKWGVPVYMFQNTNIVAINGLKECCALGFFKGALLADPHGILQKPGEHTQVPRVIRFSRIQDIVEMEPILKAYIYEAIEVEKAGLEIIPEKKKLIVPEEFQKILDGNPALKKAFYALTPGRQRGYNLYFSQAKQSKTRSSRVEKCIPQILRGRGLNE